MRSRGCALTAFAEQRRLGEVARDVVARRLRFMKDT